MGLIRAAFRCWGERLFVCGLDRRRELRHESKRGFSLHKPFRFFGRNRKSKTVGLFLSKWQVVVEGAVRRRRLRSKRADSEVGPYKYRHQIAICGMVDIEEGRTKVPALHGQDNQESALLQALCTPGARARDAKNLGHHKTRPVRSCRGTARCCRR